MNRSGWYSGTGWLVGNARNYPTRRSAVFVTGEDFMRLSLQAYYAALRSMMPPQGEGWLEDAGEGRLVSWSSGEDLFDHLLSEMALRLRDHARTTGHYTDIAAGGPVLPQAEPAVVMGHGCPALLPAVGPAPEASNDAEHNLPAAPLFRACDPQGLQLEKTRVDNRPNMAGGPNE